MKSFKCSKLVLVTVTLLTACSSTPTVNGVKYEKDEVLATSGDKPMPSWAEDGELKPFIFKDGKFLSVGVTTIPGSDRPDAGLRIAENNARSNFAKGIENKLEFIFQNAEENTGFNSTQAKFIGSEMSSMNSHGMNLEGHFWKRIVQSQEDGSKKILYKLYALVSMNESDFKQAMYAAIHKGESQNQLSDKFQKQVDAQWDHLLSDKDH